MKKIVKIILILAIVILPAFGLAQTTKPTRPILGSPINTLGYEYLTWDATDIKIDASNGSASAKLHGIVPFGQPLISNYVAYFRYSSTNRAPIYCENFYGSNHQTSKDIPMTSDNLIGGQFVYTVTGLKPGTTYHYCSVVSQKGCRDDKALKPACAFYGKVKDFTTPNYLFLASSAATGVTDTDAILNGAYKTDLVHSTNPAIPGKIWFNYRRCQVVSPTNPCISNLAYTQTYPIDFTNGTKSIKLVLENLEPDTTYEYYLDGATHPNGSSFIPSDPGSAPSGFINNPITFTTITEPTLGLDTSIETKLATGISGGNAWLNGIIYGSDYNSLWFEWGLNENSLGSLTPIQVPLLGSHSFKQKVTNLASNKIYYFRAVGGKSTGTVHRGTVVSFITGGVNDNPICFPPQVLISGSCVTPHSCIAPDIYSALLNTCVTPLICTPPDVFSSGTGTCVTPLNCLIGQVFSPASNSCIVPPNCSSPLIYDPNQIACVFPPGRVLPGTGPGVIPGGPSVPGTPSFNDAIVRKDEGVEHVFVRQIKNNSVIAKLYGYQAGMDLELFANDTAHLLAKIFGYIDSKGKEVRVSFPDVAAYELKIQPDGRTEVKEWLGNLLIDTRKLDYIFKTPPHTYEYYFKK